jgi:hypothetical protein
MSDQKKEVSRMRICQRDDGVVYTYTPALESNKRMVPGVLIKYSDGTKTIQLDKAKLQDLDPNRNTKQINDLIEENRRLREQLTQSQGFTSEVQTHTTTAPEPASAPAQASQPVKLQEGESPIGEPEYSIKDVDPTAEIPSQTIPLAPEPEILGSGKLQAMKKEDLADHARRIRNTVEIPADLEQITKAELLEICKAEQEAYQKRTGASVE